MGIIAAVTTRVTTAKLIPKVDVSSKDIIEIGSIEALIFRRRGKSSSLKYGNLQQLNVGDSTNIFNILWKCAWMLKPQRPLWNGFMQMIHKGEHPGQASVIFMPMTDIKSSDESGVFYQLCTLLQNMQNITTCLQY